MIRSRLIHNRHRSGIVSCGMASLFAVLTGCGGVAERTEPRETGTAAPGTEPGATRTRIANPGSSEQVGTSTQAMTNGVPLATNSLENAVAVYTNLGSSYRLCSGVIVQDWWGWTAVLTARHCVTDTGLPDGNLVPAGYVKVSEGGSVNPGASPPSDAYTPSGIDAPAPIADSSNDYAVLWIAADLGILGSLAFIDRGSISDLPNARVIFQGYGKNGSWAGGTAGEAVFTVSSTGGFPPTSAGNFSFINQGLNHNNEPAYLEAGDDGSAAVACCDNFNSGNDCGGNNIWWCEVAGVLSRIGQHNASSTASAVAGFADWLQDDLWVNYITSVNTPVCQGGFGPCNNNYHVGVSSLGEGGWVWGRAQGDSDNTRITYHSTTQEIRIWNTNFCFALDRADASWPDIYTCDGSVAQKWTVDKRRIKNVLTGQCLTDNGDWPYLGPCDDTNATAFLFGGQF